MEKAYIALIGVVVGAILTMLKDIWFDWRKRKKERTFLAIQIVGLLDRFISKCASVVTDDGLVHGQCDEDGGRYPQVKTPDFEPHSVDVDWKSLPADLLYEILELPSQVEEAHRYVSSVWEYEASQPDYDELFEALIEKYSALGLSAIDMANQLRVLADLPEKPAQKWEPKDVLTRAQCEAAENKKRRGERLQESIPKHFLKGLEGSE